jgi:hypothetical protein
MSDYKKRPTPEEEAMQLRLMQLLKENTKGMTVKQMNLYLEHLKNKLKNEGKKL